MSFPPISDNYFEQFTTGKYKSKSKLQRWAIRNFMNDLQSLLKHADTPSNFLEVGCGEGFIVGHLAKQYTKTKFTGFDLREANITTMKALFPEIQSSAENFFDFKASPNQFDTIICCEVLEHLEEPQKAIERFHELQPNYLLLSVPNEPFFQATCYLRGKNRKRWGNPADHLNHWNRFTFKKLLSSHFDVVKIKTPYPWLMVLATPKKNISV